VMVMSQGRINFESSDPPADRDRIGRSMGGQREMDEAA